jgi:hypothetical protein
MEFKMRNKVIALFVALGISLSFIAPARAQFIPWGYGGLGYGYGAGFGYSAAIAGIGLAAGAIGAAAIANSYPYGGYGYAPVPVYEPVYPAYSPRPTVRKQIIIRNSPGARVYEEDDIFGW